ERNLRNGWVRPYRPTLSAAIETVTHPAWLIEFLRHGLPYYENWRPYAPPNASALQTALFFGSQIGSPITWKDVEWIRRIWDGNLVLKGVLRSIEAAMACDIGVDGLIVSNHGGRQCDRL